MAEYIDKNRLKNHYAWWGNDVNRRIFDQVVDAQPTIEVVEDDDTQELRPCPFCGCTELEILKDELGHPYVFCPSCGGSGSQFSTIERSIAAWNSRVFTCPVCGIHVTQKEERS